MRKARALIQQGRSRMPRSHLRLWLDLKLEENVPETFKRSSSTSTLPWRSREATVQSITMRRGTCFTYVLASM